MNDQPRRPTLHLKMAPPAAALAPALAPPRKAPAYEAPPPPPPAAPRWKCRPCGSAFELPTDAPEDFIVRCPSCHARLGKLVDFAADGGKVRARLAPAPAARRS
jgi:hypothetical protein